MRARVLVVIAVLAVGLVVYSETSAGELSRRLAERGPTTPVVGAMFAVSAPIGAILSVVRGQSPRLAGCRFGHGLAMLGAGVVVLPAGLVLAPFHAQRLPGAWMDPIVDAVQEDYCTRPMTSVLP